MKQPQHLGTLRVREIYERAGPADAGLWLWCSSGFLRNRVKAHLKQKEP